MVFHTPFRFARFYLDGYSPNTKSSSDQLLFDNLGSSSPTGAALEVDAPYIYILSSTKYIYTKGAPPGIIKASLTVPAPCPYALLLIHVAGIHSHHAPLLQYLGGSCLMYLTV